MQKSGKSHMGKARASHPRKAVFRERVWPSWTSLLIGCTTPTRSVLSFFSGRQARGSHRLRMRSHVASIKCTVLHHPLSFCGRSNPKARLTTSLQLLLAISPTAIRHSKPHLGGSLRTTLLFDSVLVTTLRFFNPLSWNRLRICTSSVLFSLQSMP